MEYLTSSLSTARRAFADHYGTKFYVNSGCMENDYQLTPNDPSDLSSCVVASGGHLKHFSVNGSDDPNRVEYLSYSFEGGVVSEDDLSRLVGGAPLDATTEAPVPLQGLYARHPSDRLYKSRDGQFLVGLMDEPNPRLPWDKRPTVYNVTVYNFEVFAHPTERMLRCYRAYHLIK
jgi:hypothetical protein